MKKLLMFIFALMLAVGLSPAAFAQAVDYTTMTGAVSFTAVITAFLAIGATLMAMYVAWKGIKLVIGMLKGG